MTRRIEEKIRITTEAVAWLQRLEAEPGQETADEFAEWLHASPHHLASFLKQSEIEEAIRRTQAQRRARPPHVYPSESVPSAPLALVTKPAHRTLWALAATFMLLTAVWVWRTAGAVVHLTADMALPVTFSSGSSADLYPDTQLSSRSVAGFSEITVDRGGGQFHVRHRPWQRFQVQAGGVLITATGTAFNVFRTDERTGVYVAEGSVRLDGHLQTTILREGQSAYVSADGVIGSIYAAAPGAAAAKRYWNDVSLAAIAEEINRRSRSPQIVVQGAARERRFRGYVGLDDPEAWIAALATYSDLKIERHRNQVTIRGGTAARP